ncbi:hypothetical protein TNCV_3354091 [Trichonephila clavipes]|nr:hypothetical protein TNCV_3354091 [Trichonephila clavipes]
MVESAAGAINQSLKLVVCHPGFSADHSNRLAVEDLLQQSILLPQGGRDRSADKEGSNEPLVSQRENLSSEWARVA